MIFVWAVLLLPFFGTVLGSLGVFGLRELRPGLHRALEGSAAGVMTAAAVWSLLLPAIRESARWGSFAFLPAALGLWAGFLFLLALERLTPKSKSLLLPAVTIHNLPEGMAVGVVIAGWLTGSESISFAAALALALGIALQNLPEGAIISMPLKSNGMKRGKAFGYGVLSGAVEPLGAIVTILLANLVVPVLPYLLVAV